MLSSARGCKLWSRPDKGECDEGEAEPDGAGAGLQELEADAEGDHKPWEEEKENGWNVSFWKLENLERETER